MHAIFAFASKQLNVLAQFIKKYLALGLGLIGPPLAIVLRPVGLAFLWIARKTRLDRIFPWRYLSLIAKPYLTQDRWFEAWLLCGFTILLMVATAKSAYYMGLMLKDFTDVIEQHKSDAEYYIGLAWLSGAALAWAVCSVFYGFVRSWFGLDWRTWLTQMLLRQWTVNEAYLHLSTELPQLDNMDQRLSQDPDTFANTTVWLSIVILDAVVNVWTFLPVLWASDMWLVLGCGGCAVVSYGVVFWFGRKLPSLTFQQWKREADLRTNLQPVVRSASTVAMMQGENLVLGQALGRLAAVRETLWEVMKVNRNVSLFTTIWSKVVEYGPYSYIGWLLLHGHIKALGAIGQGVQAFGKVHDALTVFSGQFGALSNLKAQCERLGPLCEALETIGAHRMPEGEWITYSEGDKVVCKNVTVSNSYFDRKPVVKVLTIEITDNVMFAAPEGQGKTSLARAFILGCAPGSGEIQRPPRSLIGALVQNPYMPRSSLKEFLCDRLVEKPTDARILEVLGMVELKNLAQSSGGLDEPQEWQTKLSAPEQQQLCFARAILCGVKLLIIDQALQGLQPEYSALIYRVAKALSMQVITFANDVPTAKYHDRVVELAADGTWNVMPADAFKEPAWRALLRYLTGE
jgi:putative ATP-binding cassette transporter